MNRLMIQATCIFVGWLMLTGCAKGPDRDIEYQLFVTHPSLEMIEGDEVQIIASPTNQSFTWRSGDDDVVTVSETGLAHAVGDGACFIYVTSSGGLSRDIPVDVSKFLPLEGIHVFNKETIAPVTELSLSLGQSLTLDASPTPSNYNERIPFNVIWKSDNTNIVEIDETSGKLTAKARGATVITVASIEKPTVQAVIPVEVPEIPIEEIQVTQTLNLKVFNSATVTPTLLPANYSADATLEWASNDESVATVTNGIIEGVSIGTAKVTVSLKSDPSIKAEINISVAGYSISEFTNVANSPNLIGAKVVFKKGEEIPITGIEPSTYETAYNRDFMSYDSHTGKITFIEESGEYDVAYSSVYNYIWVYRENDKAPDCYWILAAGFSSASQWHSDFSSGRSWSGADIRSATYMKSLGDEKYQATIYIKSSDGGNDVYIEINIHGSRNPAGDQQPSKTLTGDYLGLETYAWGYLHDGVNPIDGYYRVTLDMTENTLHFEQLY